MKALRQLKPGSSDSRQRFTKEGSRLVGPFVNLYRGAGAEGRSSHWAAIALVACIAVSATTGIGLGDSWFDEQRVVTLCVTSVCALATFLFARVPRSKTVIPLLAALALGLLSSLQSARPSVALVEWSTLCLIGLLILAARSAPASKLETAIVVSAVIVPLLYVTGVMARYVSALLLGFPVGAETLLVGFGNPRFPAQLQVLTIPLLPIALARAPTALWRVVLVVIGMLWWMCFVGSGSRTGWIAVAGAAIVVASLASEGRRWLNAQVLFAVGGLLLWGLLFYLLPAVLSVPSAPETGRFSSFASVAARWTLWSLSIHDSLAHPVLGVGPMHFAYAYNGEGAHPHNFWLQLAAEWGIPVALLVWGAAAGLFIQLWRAVRSEREQGNRFVGVALVAAVAAWIIGTFADGYMVVPTSQAMSAVVLMLAVMWLRLSTPETRASEVFARIVSYVSTAFLVIALGVLAVLPFTQFGRPTQREQAWRAEHPGEAMWPRFWQQGWIGPDADPTAR